MAKLGRLSERIYRELRHEIDSGTYRANSRFPTEKELCKRFNCSHFTIRKVIAQLIEEEIIISRRGSGSYVKPSFYQHQENKRSIVLIYLGNIQQLTAVQNYALQKDYLISVYSQEENAWIPSKESQFLQLVKNQRPQALLVFGSRWSVNSDVILTELDALGVRVIHYEYTRSELPAQNYILPNYHFAGYMAGLALLLAGVKACFCLGFDEDAPFGDLQKRGFDQAMRENQPQAGSTDQNEEHFHTINLLEVTPGSEEEKAFIRWLRKTPKPCGLFCASTERAAILLHYLNLCNIDVPGEANVLSTEILTSDPACRDTMDTIVFDRIGIFKKAIDEAVRPDFDGIHELVNPTLVRNGKTLKPISI